jgi:transcriptional regulator with XRE-family HTH domain
MGITEESIDAACSAAISMPSSWMDALPGEQLSALREARRISLRQLADTAGVAPSLVSRLERGADARWQTWRKLFSALGYDAVLTPYPSSEDMIDLNEDEAYARKLRAEAGRMSRWG